MPPETLSPIDPPREVEDNYRLHRRFDRIGRLVGDAAMERLLQSRVLVIGLGGVGSHAAEALVRSGIGFVEVADFDRVCITNSNRQTQAMRGTIGKYKAEILAERLRMINPQATIIDHCLFYSHKTAEHLLGDPPDFVVDAIDNVTAKCNLIVSCRRLGIPLVSSTGASGRMDPTAIQVADLANTEVDPLAHAVRRILRQKYAFPRKGDFGVKAVFSRERPSEPFDLTYDGGTGFRCVCPGGTNPHHSCEERNVIWGTAGFVTGAFGMATASVVVRHLTGWDD